MVVLIFFRGGAVVLLRTDVELAPQNGLDTAGGRRFKKVDRTVDVAMVRNGHGLLSYAVNVGHQLFDIAGAIQQRIIRV